MAFSFGAPQAPVAAAGGQVQLGPELLEIQTQEVGFLSLNGDSKVRLFPTPWPADALPPPTSSLLSVASSRALLAAAGPEGIVIASTDSVRKAFFAESSGESNIRPFQPELQIPLPGKVSHLAFSADDNALVVAFQNGDGLAVYDVSALLQNKTQPAATIGLNGESLRALAPNPAVPTYFAAVTTNGELLVANLITGQLEAGPNGPVLKTGVSSVSWSNKGKQLVAGLGDGTAYQMTPKGEGKAEIPRPPDVQGSHHVSSLMWLKDDELLMVYTPTTSPDDRPSSSYYILTRRDGAYMFQRLPEVCSPFGLERYPSFQFTGRLKNFQPNLKDVLIVSSTASTDVGLFTKSMKPLVDDCPAEKITNVFTTTTMSEDSRRAEVPMTEDLTDTSPVGLAMDLSSKDNVASPIPGEDMKESATPLPAIMILNNDGVLASWWFVYAESVRQQKPFHGLSEVLKTKPATQQQAAPQIAAVPETPKPAFGGAMPGQSPFGQPAFGKPATPAFGTATPLGAGHQQPAFGAATPIGAGRQQPAFGSPSTLGSSQPAFGSTTPMGGGGVAFGAPSALGQSGAAFGKPSTSGPARSLFGQTPTQSTAQFGAGGGFSSFATSGGFGGALTSHTPEQSPFVKATGDNTFGKATGENIFGKATGENPFANAGQPVFGAPSSGAFTQKEETAPSTANAFGSGGGFVLGSTFSGEASAAMDEDQPEQPNGAISFDSFGKTLDLKAEQKPSVEAQPKPSLFGSPFLKISDAEKTTSTVSPFGALPSSNPKSPLSIPEPPLPPEPTSRADYGPGDTSASSSNASQIQIEDAPLPPDFLAPKKSTPAKAREPTPEPELPSEPESPKEPALPESPIQSSPEPESPKEPPSPESPEHVPPALPDESDEEEDEDEDFEDSGEEVTHEISPTDFKTSPESSFGGVFDQSPTGGLFTKVSAPKQKLSKPLFGEVSETPKFPPPELPKGRVRLSPRSPSPVRNLRGTDLRSPESLRSTSAPAPGRALSHRKAALQSSILANQVTAPPEDFLDEIPAREAQRQADQLAAEAQELVEEEDEDEQLRSDLARPLSPAPTLDPFYPHQDYTGESLKPGIPGQIERLYRDINAMIGTLGINARSLSAFLLYQQSNKDASATAWLRTLRSENYAELLDEKLLLSEVEKLQQGVDALDQSLQVGKIEGIQDKLERCHQLFSKDLVQLRGQCASMRKTLDSYTDAVAIASAPLSAEQAALQQDLRKLSTEVQAKLADLEKDVTLLRARIADCSKPADSVNGSSRKNTARPTVEAVTSTINTMTNMAEKKSGDIDVLEAQMRKLGLDISGSVAPGSREASPFSTPAKRMMSWLPATPGSRASVDGGGTRTLYHTPESNRTSRFRSSVLSQSTLRGPVDPAELVSPEDVQQWKAKVQRRQEVVGHLKAALRNRKVKLRGLDDF